MRISTRISISLLACCIAHGQGAMFFGQNIPAGSTTGTFSLVQKNNCAVGNGATTCTMTVSPNFAAGNLDRFSCVVPNGAGSPVSKISSVSNAGGTLVLAQGASMGNQPSGSNLQQSTAYILPATSSGGSGSVVVTVSQASSSTGGNCVLEEWHPSANGANVALDIDGAYQPSTACTTCVQQSVTLSGTNDVVFEGFTSVSNFTPPSAITSPFTTNQFFGSFSGFSSAATTTTNPSWTAASTIPVMSTVAIGFNPLACNEVGINDFTGGTNNTQITGANVAATAKGWQGGQWIYTTGGVDPLKYFTAAVQELQTSTGRLCGDGGTYPTGAPTTGIGFTGTGTTMGQDVLFFNWAFNNFNAPLVSSGFWYWSDRAVGDSADENLDCSSIYGVQAADFISVNCYIDGTTPYFNLEAGSGNASQSHVSYTASTWVWVEQLFTSVGNSAGGSNSVTAAVSSGTATFTGTFTAAKYPIGTPFSVAACTGGTAYNGTLFTVVTASASTITALANGASGSATTCTLTGQHVMNIYNSSAALLGSQWVNSLGSDFPGRLHFGNLHSALIIGSGKHAYFGSMKLSLVGTHPIGQ